ncbi:MAG TPA: hypothetical protein VOB72_14850 [Candidatus Dormibacteraeota bacterium]|nr:hypothetical protein [Candidatus Dormibacteraeota bacterium]
MFLKSVIELPIDFEAVRPALLERPERWLDSLAAAARDDQDRLLVDVGLGYEGGPLTCTAMLSVGTPAALGARVISLPLHLRMAEHAELFPVLEGDLDAAWLGSGRTHLALAVQYQSPYGLLGELADGPVLHRVAELVVQRLLASVGGRLTSLCAEANA